MFESLNIARRLRISFLSIIFMLVVLLGFVFYATNTIKKIIIDISEDKIKKIVLVEQEISNRNNHIARAFRNLLIFRDYDKAEIEKEKKVIIENKDVVLHKIEDYVNKSTNPKAIATARELLEKQKVFVEQLETFLQLQEKNQKNEMYKTYMEMRSVFRTILTLSDELTQHQIKRAAQEAENANNFLKYIFYFLSFGGIVILFLSIYAGMNTISYIKNRIHDITTSIRDIDENGNFKTQINTENKDELGVVADALANMAGTFYRMQNEIKNLTQSALDGNLSERGNVEEFKGDFQEIIIGVNNTLDALIEPLHLSATYIESISKGNIPEKIEIEYKGDFESIKNNINSMIDTFNQFVEEMDKMYNKQENGDTDYFMPMDKFSGIYKKMISSVNLQIKTLILEQSKIIEIVGEYGKGNFGVEMQRLPGKKMHINVSLDRLKQNMILLNKEISFLINSMIEGKLSTRGNEKKFEYIFYSSIINGINRMLDTIIEPLNLSAKYIENISNGVIPEKINRDYKGDFESIKNNINSMIRTLDSFVVEMNLMYDYQEKGQIHHLIPSDRFSGVYKKIADSVNVQVQTLLNEQRKIVETIGEYSKGNFGVDIQRLPGEKVYINENLDRLKDNMANLNDELTYLINSAINGELSKRGDAKKFEYQFYSSLVIGINKMLDEITEPIKEATVVLQEVSSGNLESHIVKKYKGDHALIANALNKTNKIILEKIKETDVVLTAIADGNLLVETKTEYIGDFNQIKSSLYRTRNALQRIISEINQTGTQVAYSAEQIVGASIEISQGASQQAASVDQISASIQEILNGVKQNNSNASSTERIATSTADKSIKGMKAINQTLEAMRGIVKRIAIIEEITTQTNLLSVNASIESAKAGEHGIGFSVVAIEIKKLAQNSKKAAEEIREIASNSLLIAENAVRLFETIVPDVQHTADLVLEISIASKQQTSSLNQISVAVQQLNEITHQNAAASEELSSTGELLKKQSNDLKTTVSYFKI